MGLCCSGFRDGLYKALGAKEVCVDDYERWELGDLEENVIINIFCRLIPTFK